jgi:hypothetical protein
MKFVCSQLSRSILAAAAFALAIGVSVNAASGQPATLEQRVKGAQKIVVATARGVNSGWLTTKHGDRVIVTSMELEVEETLKGMAKSVLIMEVPGGTVDGVTLRVSGQPVVTEGERAVFFLDAEEAGSHKPHLRGQGVLKLDSSNVVRGSSLRLDDIRRAARAAKN